MAGASRAKAPGTSAPNRLASRPPLVQSPVVSTTTDFFISYTGKDRQWAEWIAITLRNAGFTTRVQSRDFGPGSQFVVEMQKAAVECVRVMPVLSPDYFKSKYTLPEWTSAFAFDPTGEKRKIVPVRIQPCDPPGMLAQIGYIDLIGLKKDAAKEKLLQEVQALPVVDAVFPGEDSPPEPAEELEPKTSQSKPKFLHNLPFSPNPFFTGRDQLLQELHVALHTKTAAAITQPQAVHGLGGVGKTQLAIEYTWANHAEYDAVLWAATESRAELHANVATLAAVLRLPEAAARQQEVRVAAVLDWLRAHRRWLLLLDNADTPEAQQAVAALLPPGLPGHVIVTSRRGGWPLAFADVEVPVLAPEAAEKFLIERTQKAHFHAGTPAEARAVAGELGFLPLALEQAAAYLGRMRVSFADYRRKLADSRAELLKFPSQGGTGYQRTVATTWLVTEAQLSPRARAVLQLAALLAPDEIPRALFTKGGEVIEEAMKLLAVGGEGKALTPTLSRPTGEGEESDAQRENAAGSDGGSLASLSHRMGEGAQRAGEGDVDDALAELAGYSLVELEAESFTLHRLLQAVLHDRLVPDARRPWLDHAIQLVNDFAPFQSDDARTWPVWDRVRPHAAAILRETGDENTPTAAVLMSKLGLLLTTKALYAEAEPLYRRTLVLGEKNLGLEHPEVAIRLNNLATLLYGTNRLAEAEPLMRRALAMDEKSFGPEHPKVATDLNNLATLYYVTNRLAEAEPLMRRAVEIFEKSLGPEHPNTQTVKQNYARLQAALEAQASETR